MYNVNFKFRQLDLVGVIFDDNDKRIGQIESFRFTEHCKPLYRVEGIGMYIPETMLIELTENQKSKYEKQYPNYMKLRTELEEFNKNIAKEILG